MFNIYSVTEVAIAMNDLFVDSLNSKVNPSDLYKGFPGISFADDTAVIIEYDLVPLLNHYLYEKLANQYVIFRITTPNIISKELYNALVDRSGVLWTEQLFLELEERIHFHNMNDLDGKLPERFLRNKVRLTCDQTSNYGALISGPDYVVAQIKSSDIYVMSQPSHTLNIEDND